MKETKTFTAYLCGVDWQHELGEAADGTMVFPHFGDYMKRQKKCWDSCGVVRVKATFEFEAWEVEQDLMKGATKACGCQPGVECKHDFL